SIMVPLSNAIGSGRQVDVIDTARRGAIADKFAARCKRSVLAHQPLFAEGLSHALRRLSRCSAALAIAIGRVQPRCCSTASRPPVRIGASLPRFGPNTHVEHVQKAVRTFARFLAP